MELENVENAVIVAVPPAYTEEQTRLLGDMTNQSYGYPKVELCDYMLNTFTGLRVNLQNLFFLVMALIVNPYDIISFSFTEKVVTREFIETLGYYLMHNMLPNISKINLGNNKDGDFLAETIAKVFQFNPNLLKNLSIYGNQITDVGAIKIAQSLKDNTTLVSLELSCNNIGDAGAIAIAEWLISNTNLEYLDLSQNHISDIGLEALCNALKVNKTLLGIKISHNVGIRNWGVLIPVLEVNFGIQNLIIDEYSCPINISKSIEALRRRNMGLYQDQYWRPLRHLSFPSNSIYRESWCSARINYSCHNMIISSIICNGEFSVRLPIEVWKYIFSFFKRKNFRELY
jgi:hypothetical protein